MRVVPTAESKLAQLEDCTADLQISHTRYRFSIDLVDVDVVDDGSDQISQADCSATGGPASAEDCAGWFANLWDKQATWMEDGVKS